jgi:uncharacterized protein (DUF1778 family)
MAKTKRIQVPVTPADERAIRAAARLYKISAAEWMRRIAIKAAQSDFVESAARTMTPKEALDALSALDLPVDDVGVMKKQSIRGRLRR